MADKVSQSYTWFAMYKNGTMFSEFNPDGTENLFRDIDVDNVVHFGLMGSGSVIGFSTANGVMDSNGKRLELSYGDTRLTFVDGTKYDLITYKDAEALFDPTGGTCTSNAITKFNVGYKTKVQGFSLKVIYTIDELSGKKYISVRLVSDVDRDEILKIGDYEVRAPLKAGVGGEVTIEVK